MKHQSKFNQEQEQSRQLGSEQQTRQSAREFANAEELLRYDAGQTLVPPGIAQRLRKSSAELPPPARSWWRRLFGR